MEVDPLTTERLRLRAYRDADRDEFVELFSNPIVMAHVGGALGPEEARRMFAAIVAGTHRRALAAWMVERQVGGLGMYLMRKLMDEVRYEIQADGGNLLTLIKRKE